VYRLLDSVWLCPPNVRCVEESHVFYATDPAPESVRRELLSNIRKLLPHILQIYMQHLLNLKSREERPIFVGDAAIIATKGGTLVGMVAKEFVIDLERLKLCTRNLCMPLYTRR